MLPKIGFLYGPTNIDLKNHDDRILYKKISLQVFRTVKAGNIKQMQTLIFKYGPWIVDIYKNLYEQSPYLRCRKVPQYGGHGTTALIEAIVSGQNRMVEFLLENRANSNLFATGPNYDLKMESKYALIVFVKNVGTTFGMIHFPIHVAAREKNIEAIALLRNHGARIRILDSKGNYPEHCFTAVASSEEFQQHKNRLKALGFRFYDQLYGKPHACLNQI